MIKVIASDMDGTLLGDDHRIAPETLAAIRRACDAGIRFMIATGRNFKGAMEELKEEGGISARAKRYRENNQLLIRRMRALGIETYIDDAHQGPIITTFFTPKMDNFSFAEMYEYIKKRGYAIYPGKVTDADTFRIGNIGEIYKEDIEKVSDIIEEYFEKCCGGLVRQTA